MSESASRCIAKRKARTVSGTDDKKWWHSESSKKSVEGAAPGEYFHKFSYKEKMVSGVIKTGWLMMDYGVSKEHGGAADLIIYKIYCSPCKNTPRWNPCFDYPCRAITLLSV
ncbi:hypothetical protein GUJ93_ZPchr0012g21403 [Zizania palustris]|uniref:NAC domain-containing protein n=1 Tax=Zizania palustris TaxID=103762 RepID=A0A8J6BNA6_ZIZPA|nr:hypothetical protein GUJ93_ZPchr0012g21403 [Zizania palustris]